MSSSTYSQRQSQIILDKALSLSLNVSALTPIPGDGNCFYHSVIDALSTTGTPYNGTHLDLRRQAVSFVDKNRHLEFVQRRVDTTIEEDLSHEINRQYQHCTYVNELFVRATAITLNVAISSTLR